MGRHFEKWKYRVAVVAVALLLAFFAGRALDAYKALMEKAVYGKADIHSIRGWMNVDRLSRIYNADPACICGQFNLSLQDCQRKSMWELNDGGGRRLPPSDGKFVERMTPVYEKVTFCMFEKPKPEDWMRVDYASRLYSADAGCICKKMGIPDEDCLKTSVGDIVRQRGPAQEPGRVKEEFWNIVGECGRAKGGQ
jgi:hypothetical protein